MARTALAKSINHLHAKPLKDDKIWLRQLPKGFLTKLLHGKYNVHPLEVLSFWQFPCDPSQNLVLDASLVLHFLKTRVEVGGNPLQIEEKYQQVDQEYSKVQVPPPTGHMHR